MHGVAPGSKTDGVWRLIYENLNEIQSRLVGNDKLDKAKSIIDDMVWGDGYRWYWLVRMAWSQG